MLQIAETPREHFRRGERTRDTAACITTSVYCDLPPPRSESTGSARFSDHAGAPPNTGRGTREAAGARASTAKSGLGLIAAQLAPRTFRRARYECRRAGRTRAPASHSRRIRAGSRRAITRSVRCGLRLRIAGFGAGARVRAAETRVPAGSARARARSHHGEGARIDVRGGTHGQSWLKIKKAHTLDLVMKGLTDEMLANRAALETGDLARRLHGLRGAQTGAGDRVQRRAD